MSALDNGEHVVMMWDVKVARYNGVAALAFIVYDSIITFGDEVRYIWPQSNRSPTKWVFLFTRYFGLLAQIGLNAITFHLSHNTSDNSTCRTVYISQVISGGLLMACIQSLLMLRVWALYIRNRRMAIGMISLLVAEVGVMPGIIHLTIPSELHIGKMCMKPITKKDIVFFGISAVLPQILVLALTIVKFLSALRAGWGKLPIVLRLVRDDIILVSLISGIIIVSACLTNINNMYSYAGYSWLLSAIPSVGCRVVTNMQKLAVENARRHGPNNSPTSSLPQLTSCLFDILSNSADADISMSSISKLSQPWNETPILIPTSSRESNAIQMVPRSHSSERSIHGHIHNANSPSLTMLLNP